MNFKKWLYYRFMRTMVKMHASMPKINDSKITLDEVQRPMYDICIKMINDRSTDLRSMRGDYQLENDEYFVSIKYSSSTPIISLVESRDRCSNIHTVFIENHYVESIIDSFEREMSRRMRYRDSSRKKEISEHLKRIINEFKS